MRVLAGILYTPPWARPAGTAPGSPPSNLGDYAAFVRIAVQRYAQRGVHAYEIWNEPNVADFWAPGPDPARYAQLLRRAYAAVKSVDPTATVVSAGLAPYGAYGEHSNERMNPLDFLEGMYAHGAAGSFDALGWHPSNYPWGLSFARWSAWSQLNRTTPARVASCGRTATPASRSGRPSSPSPRERPERSRRAGAGAAPDAQLRGARALALGRPCLLLHLPRHRRARVRRGPTRLLAEARVRRLPSSCGRLSLARV
jgi:hypothetical protein